MGGVVVAVDVERAPLVPHDVPLVGISSTVLGIFRRTDAYLCNALLYLGRRLHGAGAGLVVVVDHVDIHALAAVAALAAPVVDDVVAHVHALVGLGAGARTQSRRAALIVGHQVVVVRRSAAAPVAAVAVSTFRVSGVLQALAGDAPLHGDVLAAVHRQALVDAPRHGAVVDDDVVMVHRTQSVAFVVGHILVAQSEAHVAHDDVVAAHRYGIVGHADAVAGRRLSQERLVALDGQSARQVDGAADVEDDDACGVALHGLAQRAVATVVGQRRHVVNAAAASAGGVHAEALGAGKCGKCLCR